jgi:UDPglucose 6-dehydrogenase
VSRIAVIGTGYVGLTTGVCLARLGHEVTCADVDQAKVAALSRGEVPMLEPGMDRLLVDGLRRGRLRFVVGGAAAVIDAEFVCLCVPTPQGDDGAADLSFLRAACEEIRPFLADHAIVINKSTVPIGTARMVSQMIGRPDVSVVSNPEFLREGHAVDDFLNPTRIVIGGDDQGSAIRVASLYVDVTAPVILTDAASAETIKYAANSFLAIRISFINAIASICENVGADIEDVVRGMGHDRRIGHECLRPGPGWGGSCLPKDTAALLRTAADSGYEFTLLRSAVSANEAQKARVVDKIRSAAGGSIAGRRIAVWGLTFKANTDDLRDSPALDIIERLRGEGAEIVAFDPSVSREVDGIEVVADPYGACEGADVLAVLTEWDDFQWLDLEKVSSVMRGCSVVDARNVLDPEEARFAGLHYDGTGR